jgi:(p)ppGpp synthase/HD superfamily hydrolase
MAVAEVSFRTEYKEGMISDVNRYMHDLNVKILKLSIKKKKDGSVIVSMTVRTPKSVMPDTILDTVNKHYMVSEFTAQLQ